MSKFSPEAVELAVTQYSSPDPSLQQIGALFLTEWKDENPDILLQALAVLSGSRNQKTKFFASIAVHDTVHSNYGTYGLPEREQVRSTLKGLLLQNAAERLVADKISETLVLVAMHDWPERWPEFPFDVYPERFSAGIGTVGLFDKLVDQVTKSTQIDTARRYRLINCVKEVGPRIMEAALAGFDDSMKVRSAISLVRSLTKLLPITEMIREGTIFVITGAFREFDDLHVEGLRLANELLVDRTDAHTCFHLFGEAILRAKSAVETPSSELSGFLLRYMCKYGQLYEESGSEAIRKMYAREVIASFGWTLKAGSNILWKFWRNLAERARVNTSSNGFLGWVIRDVWPFYCRSFTSERCRKNPKCLASWRAIVSIFPEIVGRLVMDPESASSFYLYGTTMTLKMLPPEMGKALSSELILRVVSMLNDPEYQNAYFQRMLIFASAVMIDLDTTTPDANIGILIGFALKLATSDENHFRECAVELLANTERIVTHDSNRFVCFLMNGLRDILLTKQSHRVFDVLNKLECTANGALAGAVASCITGIMKKEVPIECLPNVLRAMKYARGPVLELLGPATSEMSAFLLTQGGGDEWEKCVEMLIEVLFEAFPVWPVRNILFLLSSMIQALAHDPNRCDQLYQLVTKARTCHQELESVWPVLYEHVVSVQVQGTDAVLPSFFYMISAFDQSINMLMESLPLVTLCSVYMRSLDEALTSGVLFFLKTVTTQMSDEHARLFCQSQRHIFLSNALETLTDMLHGSAVLNICDLLRVLLERFGGDRDFNNDFVDTIVRTVPGAADGSAVVLLEFLKGKPVEVVEKAVCDFLVSADRLTPEGMGQINGVGFSDDENSDDDLIGDLIAEMNGL